MKTIREIAKEAGYDTNSYDPFGLFSVEEFATLIIRDCLEWCDFHATDNGTAQAISASIKEYFEVYE